MSNVPMTRREDLLAEHLTSDHHMAFLQLADGRILRAAGGEFIASEDGGMTWSEPFQRRDKNGNVVGGGGTSMVNLSGKGIGLAAIGGRTPPPPGETLAERAKRMEADRGTTHMLYWRSDDGGETWEPPVRVAPEGVRAHALHDVMIRTSSGRLVLPVYISMGKGTGPNDERPHPVQDLQVHHRLTACQVQQYQRRDYLAGPALTTSPQTHAALTTCINSTFVISLDNAVIPVVTLLVYVLGTTVSLAS